MKAIEKNISSSSFTVVLYALKKQNKNYNDNNNLKYFTQVFNLSLPRKEIGLWNPRVLDVGWPDQLAPPLERLCSVCRALDSWLQADPQHVAVLHSKCVTQSMAYSFFKKYIHFLSFISFWIWIFPWDFIIGSILSLVCFYLKWSFLFAIFDKFFFSYVKKLPLGYFVFVYFSGLLV